MWRTSPIVLLNKLTTSAILHNVQCSTLLPSTKFIFHMHNLLFYYIHSYLLCTILTPHTIIFIHTIFHYPCNVLGYKKLFMYNYNPNSINVFQGSAMYVCRLHRIYFSRILTLFSLYTGNLLTCALSKYRSI